MASGSNVHFRRVYLGIRPFLEYHITVVVKRRQFPAFFDIFRYPKKSCGPSHRKSRYVECKLAFSDNWTDFLHSAVIEEMCTGAAALTDAKSSTEDHGSVTTGLSIDRTMRLCVSLLTRSILFRILFCLGEGLRPTVNKVEI